MRPATARNRARFGVFDADLEVYELRKHGIRIKLAAQPFQVLKLLLESGGEVVTRDDLRQTLWPNEPWGEHDQRLNNIVNKIREALGDSADNPRFLETLPKIGYRFLSSVEFLGDATGAQSRPLAEQSGLPALPEAPAALDTTETPSSAQWPIFSHWPWVALSLALIAFLLIAFLFTRRYAGKSDALAQAAPLTTYVGSELFPSLAPNGSQVAFAWDGETAGQFHIYVAPVTGGAPRQMTFDAANDASPVWSPDGSQIAFLRDSAPGKSEVWIIGEGGSGARKLREIRSSASIPSMSWTKDRDWLIVSQTQAHRASNALFLVSAKNGEEFQISDPGQERSVGDLNPAVSPDGQHLAFARSTSSAWSDIFVAEFSKDGRHIGEPVRLTDAHTIIDHLAWLPDSTAVVFSAATTTAGARHLFRVGASAGSTNELTELGIEGDHPSVAGAPWKLTFVRKNIEQSSVWRLDLSGGLEQPRLSRMLSSTRRDYTTDLSPDGIHIVFSSVRSGPTEIWMSETDGSNLKRLTSIGGTTPRWSPDGKSVVFESNQRGQSDIYVLTPGTGELNRLTNHVSNNRRPSWSRDGRFVYFSSDRTGKLQIWKVPSNGGDAVQITRSGGVYAVETFDGKAIYYTSPDVPADIWTTSANGGDENRVIRQVVGHPTIAMATDGLYYLSKLSFNGAQLDFYRFADRKSIGLASIDKPVHRFLSSSPDGKSVLYSQVDRRDSDLMMIDRFR